MAQLLYLSLLAIRGYLYIVKLKTLRSTDVLYILHQKYQPKFLYTKKSWCIRDFSTLVSSHINIPHGIVLVFFMHLDWYLMNSLAKVATNMHSVTCALQTGAIHTCDKGAYAETNQCPIHKRNINFTFLFLHLNQHINIS